MLSGTFVGHQRFSQGIVVQKHVFFRGDCRRASSVWDVPPAVSSAPALQAAFSSFHLHLGPSNPERQPALHPSLLDLVWRSQNLPLMIWSLATSPLTMMEGPEAAFSLSPCCPFPVIPGQIQKLFTQRTLVDRPSTHLKNLPLDGWMDRWMDNGWPLKQITLPSCAMDDLWL